MARTEPTTFTFEYDAPAVFEHLERHGLDACRHCGAKAIPLQYVVAHSFPLAQALHPHATTQFAIHLVCQGCGLVAMLNPPPGALDSTSRLSVDATGVETWEVIPGPIQPLPTKP